MKKYSLILFLLTNLLCEAQTKYFNASTIYESLNTKCNQIQVALYNAINSGVIKAYKNDSLLSFYLPGELSRMLETHEKVKQTDGNVYYSMDSAYNAPFDPMNELKGLGGLYKMVQATLDNPMQSFKLDAIFLLYQPVVDGGIQLPMQPLSYIKFEELSKVLKPKDLLLITSISNSLLSDKSWMGGPDENGFIKIYKEDYYATGTWKNFQKYSIINEQTLNALSTNIFTMAIYFLHDDMLKNGTPYYSDPELKRKYSTDQLYKIIYVPNKVVVYDNVNPAKGKDTVIYTRVQENFFKSIVSNPISIGLVTDTPDQKVIYISQKDFSRIITPWLKELMILTNE